MGKTSEKRIKRERETVEIMIGIYCHHHHGRHGKGLCPECSELLKYVDARLSHCPHGANKPTCRMCPIHCYSKDMRERIVEIMRYSGPRMLFLHPLTALRHLFSESLAKAGRR